MKDVAESLVGKTVDVFFPNSFRFDSVPITILGVDTPSRERGITLKVEGRTGFSASLWEILVFRHYIRDWEFSRDVPGWNAQEFLPSKPLQMKGPILADLSRNDEAEFIRKGLTFSIQQILSDSDLAHDDFKGFNLWFKYFRASAVGTHFYDLKTGRQAYESVDVQTKSGLPVLLVSDHHDFKTHVSQIEFIENLFKFWIGKQVKSDEGSDLNLTWLQRLMNDTPFTGFLLDPARRGPIEVSHLNDFSKMTNDVLPAFFKDVNKRSGIVVLAESTGNAQNPCAILTSHQGRLKIVLSAQATSYDLFMIWAALIRNVGPKLEIAP